MKIVVATDKFKGSLTAKEACTAIKNGLLKYDNTLVVDTLPLADGGEGSLEVIKDKLGLDLISTNVNNPVFESISATYGLKGDIAFIEMANASGLLLIPEHKKNPLSTTTLGTGELIIDAIYQGAKTIYLFVGGSATNDAGIGVAHALGYRFLDKNHNELKPIGESLNQIEFIGGTLMSKAQDVTFIVISDVKNPLYGDNGAACVFGKQKGATESAIVLLDEGLKNIARVVEKTFNFDYSNKGGAGAAGGLSWGAMSFLNATVQSGIDTILNLVEFNDLLKESDYVITGEGRFDKQTLEGKVVAGVMELCSHHKIPVGVVCGRLTLNSKEVSELPLDSIWEIGKLAKSTHDAMENASHYLTYIAEKQLSYRFELRR